MKILGYAQIVSGLRLSADKLIAIKDYPEPTDKKSLKRFYYILLFIRSVIPGRADLTILMLSVI